MDIGVMTQTKFCSVKVSYNYGTDRARPSNSQRKLRKLDLGLENKVFPMPTIVYTLSYINPYHTSYT